MTGVITDPPDWFSQAVGPPTYYMGLCDECRSVKMFATKPARDGWERHHPHEWNYQDNG